MRETFGTKLLGRFLGEHTLSLYFVIVPKIPHKAKECIIEGSRNNRRCLYSSPQTMGPLSKKRAFLGFAACAGNLPMYQLQKNNST